MPSYPTRKLSELIAFFFEKEGALYFEKRKEPYTLGKLANHLFQRNPVRMTSGLTVHVFVAV